MPTSGCRSGISVEYVKQMFTVFFKFFKNSCVITLLGQASMGVMLGQASMKHNKGN